MLANLRYLNLAGNKLSELPRELAGLGRLRFAALGNNRFTSVPAVVTRWSQVEILELIGDASFRLSMDSDEPTFVNSLVSGPAGEESHLADLHPGLRELASLRVLLLYGNPRLRLPSELLGRIEGTGGSWQGSVSEILDYYFRTRGGARPLNEAKLILLGRGGVGKTSLVNRLVHQRFDSGEERTEGIEVTSWPITLPGDEQVRLNVWDFGGQEIMHATHQFFLTTMLQGVDVESSHRPGRPAKLFVSYSHKDEPHRDALESHLKVLSRTGLLDVWHDRRIDPGGDWRGEIDAALAEADVVVLLVSADFLASDYCADVELRRARERRAAGACRVVPVIVRDCNWKKLPELADLQALPGDGRPITTWPDIASAIQR